jgi:MFS family permease
MRNVHAATPDAVIAVAEHPPRVGRGTLVSLSLSMLLSSLGTSIANVGLPSVAQAFHARFNDVQWVVIAYLLAITTLTVSVGRFADIFGRRRLLLTGIGLFIAASVLCGAAPELWLLVAARALQGVGAAIMMALSMALVVTVIPKDMTGRALGLLGTMSALGTAIGPTLGGVLITSFSWRALFLVCVPLGVLALLLAYRFLPVDSDRDTAHRVPFDYAGALLLALSLTAYVLAMTLRRGSFGMLNASLLLAAAGGLGLFAVAESKAASPLLHVSMLRDPVLRAGFVMSVLVTTVIMATLVVGPFYLSGALALGAAHVGFVMSVGPVVAALASAPGGRVVDRFGATVTTLIGLTGMAVGCVSLGVLPLSAGVTGYVASLALITAGYALFQTANNTAVMSSLRPDQVGVSSGLLGLGRNLGLITGVSVMGTLFAHATGATDILTAHPAAIAGGMRVTFFVAAMLIIVGLAIACHAARRRAERGALAPQANGCRRAPCHNDPIHAEWAGHCVCASTRV